MVGQKGHAKQSIDIIQKHVKLTETEKAIIKYHMGFYGTFEFSQKTGEYSIQELTKEGNLNPIIKLFHWCDDEEATFGKGIY
jgi:hypothetical protein